MTEVWLVRHAESEANAGLATFDVASIKLTTRGQEQAALLCDALPASPNLLVASPYARTVETARPMLRRCPMGLDIWPIQEFTYLSRDRCEHTTPEQRRPWVQAYWERSDPEHLDGEGAESFAGFLNRVRAALTRLEDLDAPLVVLFGHGLFMRAALWQLLTGVTRIDAAAMRAFRSFQLGVAVPNTAIIRLWLEAGRAPRIGPLSVAHLPSHLVSGGA